MQNQLSYSNIQGLPRSNGQRFFKNMLLLFSDWQQKLRHDPIALCIYDCSIIAQLQHDLSIRLISIGVFCNIFPTFLLYLSYLSSDFQTVFSKMMDIHPQLHPLFQIRLKYIFFYASQGQAQPSACLFKPTYLFRK